MMYDEPPIKFWRWLLSPRYRRSLRSKQDAFWRSLNEWLRG